MPKREAVWLDDAIEEVCQAVFIETRSQKFTDEIEAVLRALPRATTDGIAEALDAARAEGRAAGFAEAREDVIRVCREQQRFATFARNTARVAEIERVLEAVIALAPESDARREEGD